MSLETIREVVSMWRTAEYRRRGGSEQKNKRRNLHWEAILIKWTYGRTHRPISTDLLNTRHHHLSFLPSSYFSPAIIFFSPFLLRLPQLLCLRSASHKKPFSCIFHSLLHFLLFHSHFSLPSFMLGGAQSCEGI